MIELQQDTLFSRWGRAIRMWHLRKKILALKRVEAAALVEIREMHEALREAQMLIRHSQETLQNAINQDLEIRQGKYRVL